MTEVGGMAWFWWLPAILLIFFLLLLIIPVRLQVHFFYNLSNHVENNLKIQITIWPGLKYRKIIADLFSPAQDTPLKEPAPPAKKTNLKNKIKKWRRLSKSILPALPFLMRRTKLHRFRWHTKIGLFDACSTALAVGFLWGFKGFLLSILYRLSSPLSLPDLAIVPDFRRPSFAVGFEAAVSVRPVYILLSAIRFGYFYLARR